MHCDLGKGCAIVLLCAGMALMAGSGLAMPAGQYPSNGRERVTATIDEPYEAFFTGGQLLGSVAVDGKVLNPGTDYYHRGDGITIELSQDYLKTLAPGTYLINVYYDGGVMKSSFTVGAGEALPNIQASGSPWVFLLGASLITLIGVTWLERRRKELEVVAMEQT